MLGHVTVVGYSQTVERRLIAVNAIIALCNSGHLYPDVLKRSGYYVAGIEVPVVTDDGTVVIDIVMFQPERNIILAVEAKSGANVAGEQARRYGKLRADAVIQAASINVSSHDELRIQPLYCCPAENLVRVMHGLQVAGVQFPLLAFGNEVLEHQGAPFLDLVIEEKFKRPIPMPGPPPLIIPVDEKSPDRLFDDLVLAALIAEMSKKRTEVMVPVLAAQAIRHLGVYATAARNRLIRKVDSAARRIAVKDEATFEYLRKTGTREHAVVRFLKSPEALAPQGRTQGYQAIRRSHSKRPEEDAPSNGIQMKLFDEMADEFFEENGIAGEEDQR